MKNILKRNGYGIGPKRGPGTWDEFLNATVVVTLPAGTLQSGIEYAYLKYDLNSSAWVPVNPGVATFDVSQQTITLNLTDNGVIADGDEDGVAGNGSIFDPGLPVAVPSASFAPVLTVDASGGVTEDASSPNLTDSGTLSFTDADTTDTHIVSSVYNVDASWTGGVLTAPQIAAVSSGFTVDSNSWEYSLSNSAVQFPAAGETITLSFNVTVTDNSGAVNNFDTELVTLIIDGANDAPIIKRFSSDHAELCSSSPDGSVSTAGLFSDVDLSDTHMVTVDWGDGVIDENVTVNQIIDSFAGLHVYVNGGIYTITVTIDDGNGGTEVATATAVVQGVGVVNGTLYIIGTEGRDHVDLKFNEKKDELKVDLKLNQGGSDGGSDGGQDHIKRTFAISQIDRIVAYLCGGDANYIGGSDGGGDAAVSQFVFGGAGNDHIKGGRGNDMLSGGSGNDDIQGGSGMDILIGGTGKDKLKGGRGDDQLIGCLVSFENDFAQLDAALADWTSLDRVTIDLSDIIDDLDKDDLNGEHGLDVLFGGIGDKLKQ